MIAKGDTRLPSSPMRPGPVLERRLDPGQIEIVDDAMAKVLQKKEPWERIAIGFNLWIGVWKMLSAHLASTHPDWNQEQVRREVVRRMSHGAV